MKANDTPMFRQYWELKEKYPDCLLFFRMGDFYELFGEDAVWTAAALELTLTSRDRDAPEPMPMCGVPYHAAEGYLQRLLELGKKVAVAEQSAPEDSKQKIMRREVMRVLTPGLAGDSVEAHESSWLVCLGQDGPQTTVAFLDASTGDLRVTTLATLDAALAEAARHAPRELLLGPGVDPQNVRRALGELCTTALPVFDAGRLELRRRFGATAAELSEGAASAVTALLRYARDNLRSDLANVVNLRRYQVGGTLVIDEATRRNLEIFRPLRGTGRKFTLVGILDEARTAMGGRLLREWLSAPLLDPAAIASRQDAVAALFADPTRRKQIVDALAEVADMERITGRISQGTANARDLVALRRSLERMPALAAATDHPALRGRLPEDRVTEVASRIAATLVDEPPHALTEGGLIRDGVDADLDRLRLLSSDAKGAITQMELRLREQTGISSLKVRHSGTFGYFIEITKANLHKVPSTWHRKQTVVNGERYITPELKEYEEQASGADQRLLQLEYRLFCTIRDEIAQSVPRLQAVARGVAELDVLACFAEVAVRRRFVRPEVVAGLDLDLQGARHPVVEASASEERFVPNDVRLDEGGPMVILTGPNMAGKSTLMRQVALIVLLAQVGSFVPAQRARVGICDRIFVRVGASDDLARGQSTFMVEMSETANILQNATDRSLVLLDEIGRGTSTYDGLAIAWAVAEDLHDRVRSRVIFATHYHELAALRESCSRVRNLHVAVAEHGEKIIFLRKLREGAASGSYGIQCARLAGLPVPVVQRAREMLKSLEKKRPRPDSTQLSLFGPAPEPVLPPPDALRATLAEVDPDALSPKEAHAILYQLKQLL